MHPILFHIPLPHRPLKAWWGLVAVVVIAAIYGLLAARRRNRNEALTALVVAAGAGAGAWYWRAAELKAENVPIYSYGVMLGISLIVGWYLTLSLAERDGLPKETMANCYVITAIAALVGSRILYIITNPSQFDTLAQWFEIRRGGLVAYGGFVGGFLGSWWYLKRHGLRLMPWADVAVPSLASGLMITRIGCYLFGCDFGTRLSATAPHWLQKMGTFPKLSDGTLGYDDKGNAILGSPAYAHHLKMCQDGIYKAADCLKLKDHSLPVHPTQIYESLVGLGLLVLLLWHRKHQRFRGQIFFTFAFGYGFLRFLLELWRDDAERGSLPITLDRYVWVSLCLLCFALAFIFGISLGITNARARLVARVLSVVPAIVAFIVLKPGKFVTDPYMLSTSQFIGVVTAVIVAVFYARFWEDARKNPKQAMTLDLPPELMPRTARAKAAADAGEEEDADEAPAKAAPKRAKGKKKGTAARARKKAEAEATEKDEDAPEESAKASKPVAEPDDEEDEDEEIAPSGSGGPEPQEA